MSAMDDLAALIRDSRGLAHKRDISGIIDALGVGRRDTVAVGDDAAAIPDGDGHLLFAIEGFVEDFVAADPYFAGYCGVMVNVSDIAAMGGQPVAVIDAIWSDGGEQASPILAGLRDAATKYGVPIVGGHSNLRCRNGQLAVAILGRAKRLITSFDAEPGDMLVVATDLRGKFRDPFPWWDASSDASAEQLRGDLAILPALARDGLVKAGKDISMAGVIGTAMMLLETSQCGGAIDVSLLQKPPNVSLDRWVSAFPSFGFVFAVPHHATGQVIERFLERGIACAACGEVSAAKTFEIYDRTSRAAVWNFADPFITGSRALSLPAKAEAHNA